jgi:nitroimidazol reductase NimA-like FMN-containing flavoprotein (pyridoxamine 5'-phosphate oxidase superfamily)
MIEIEEMSEREAREILGRLNFAHLAMAEDNMPYVVPVHYAFDGEELYVYTTEGKKADIIRVNPEICLQAEEVEDNENWRSVIAFGTAKQIEDEDARQKALDHILKINPRLAPALSIRWMDSWVRQNIEVIYRIIPRSITGRRTLKREGGKRPPLLVKPKEA